MSLIKLRNNIQEAASSLQERLTQEFEHPSQNYVPPFINIDHLGERIHLLVVWDDWRSLSQQERSVLIVDAYRTAEGEGAASLVSVAMGLTLSEAERLGFDLEPA